jgi:hypothetical protein
MIVAAAHSPADPLDDCRGALQKSSAAIGRQEKTSLIQLINHLARRLLVDLGTISAVMHPKRARR